MSRPESWVEFAEADPSQVRQQYMEASENLRAALDVVRRNAPHALTYAEIEADLDWPRGRLRSVIGGNRSHLGPTATRPWHICPPNQSPRGEWEMWMDETQARAIG
jgi:hypothetical protein